MATTELAIAISNDMSMDLPTLPPNQGIEALKDVVFGSVSSTNLCFAELLELPGDPELTTNF